MKKLNYIFLSFGILLFSCNDPNVDSNFLTQEDLPMASYMKAEALKSGEYSLWVQILENTGTFTSLDLYFDYTCFVPTNAAVNEFLRDNGYASVNEIDADYAKLLVKYHTLPYTVRTEASFSNGVISDTTATGDMLTIYYPTDGGGKPYVNNLARIEKETEVTNGVIHSISKVLIPVTTNLWEQINVQSSSIFAAAIAACGVDNDLKKLYETVIIDGYAQSKKFRYTVFVVPNSVYQEKSISDLQSLAAYLGAGSDYTSHNNKLNQYVRYHIINGLVSTADMTEYGKDIKGVDLTQKNYNPLYEDGLINCRSLGSDFYLNYDKNTGKGISITGMNINSKNGLIQVVDNIMPVYVPEAITYMFEFTDYKDVADLFSDVYRIKERITNFTGDITTGSVNCYVWKAANIVNTNLSVKYYIANLSTKQSSANGGSNNTNWTPVLNADALVLTLGNGGWIEMTIPPVVQGKYAVSVIAAQRTKSDTEKDRAKLTFKIIDTNNEGQTVERTIGSTEINVSGSTLYNQALSISSSFEFATTRSQRLKIVCADAGTANLDYILFEPILN